MIYKYTHVNHMCVYDMYICITSLAFNFFFQSQPESWRQHPSQSRQDIFAKVGLEGQMVPWLPNCSDFRGV